MDKNEKAQLSSPYPGPPGAARNNLHQPAQPIYDTAIEPQPQTMVVVSQSLPTDSPGEMMCPQCRINVVTMTEYKVGTLSWLIGGIIFLTCFLPFCWIPFCVPSCKDVKHTCPRCHTTIHVHKRL
ncbi:unnamed protein product [Knipowitschia caucasica]|uniref:LITAF domain-containing protein n=1 Tax=Knipowitschia caucasica TaxID=637954 RepID=A0AAV2LNB8_KNICA